MNGMAKNQKSYTPEFKQQIVDLYNASRTSYPQLEREYGVNRSTLSSWVKQLSPIKVSEEETVTLDKEMREESEWDGKLKKAREAAGKLYEMGLDTAKIAQAVGYTVETVKEWIGLDR